MALIAGVVCLTPQFVLGEFIKELTATSLESWLAGVPIPKRPPGGFHVFFQPRSCVHALKTYSFVVLKRGNDEATIPRPQHTGILQPPKKRASSGDLER